MIHMYTCIIHVYICMTHTYSMLVRTHTLSILRLQMVRTIEYLAGLKVALTRDAIEAYLQDLCVNQLQLLQTINAISITDPDSDQSVRSTGET